MKNTIVFLSLVLLLNAGCKRETIIRKELSGTWVIEKAEKSSYTNGNLDKKEVFDNPGTLKLFNTGQKDFNKCHYEFDGYRPLGWSLMNRANLNPTSGECYWYGDLRDRDRITFWAPDIFTGTELYVEYTRVKNANGPGKKEQWMYIQLDANGKFAFKEMLYLKLTDNSGKP